MVTSRTTVLPTRPDAHARERSGTAWPTLVETLFSILAILAFLPAFAHVAGDEFTRDQRFDAPAVAPPLSAASGDATALAHSKNDAMRALMASAGGQWAGWMIAGLLLVKLARTRVPAPLGVAIALTTWAVVAWIGRVPWPFGQDRGLLLARVDAAWVARPADFIVVMLAVAAILVLITPFLRSSAPQQTLASRVGYPGFIVATGVGWLLLFDLSANGPPVNRYLALYHHGHLWLAMLALSVFVFAKPVLGRLVAWLLSISGEIARVVVRAIGPLAAAMAATFAVLVAIAVIGLLLTGIRQLTSEIGRLWLIIGVAWFFFMRGAPVAARLARGRSAFVSLVRYAWPLAFVAMVLAGTMLVTRDMGPLLIASYGAGAFLAASVAMWWHTRSGAVYVPAALAVVTFVGWIVAISATVLHFGTLHEVTAGRIENLAAPLSSANDQLALIGWFRQAVPPSGFGLGSVPWCGFAGSSCAGVPAQIQSDYTFTALVGVFGLAPAWAITIGCALWLHRLIRHHGRVTTGEPRFVTRSNVITADRQGFMSWIAVVWVVLTLCQLAVTVTGNLAVLPLTGVTFPLVSFGMTSLVVNCSMLAICLNLDLPEPANA